MPRFSRRRIRFGALGLVTLLALGYWCRARPGATGIEETELLRRELEAHLGRGDLAKGLETAHRLAEQPGVGAEGHRITGEVFHELHNPIRAVSEFEAVLAADPDLDSIPEGDRPAFWCRYTEDLMAIGRSAEARRRLEGALSRGDDPELRLRLGQAAYQLGDLDLAERSWRRLAEGHPERADPWRELGRLALVRERPEEALGLLLRAESLAPEDLGVLFGLQSAYRLLDRPEEARRVARRLALVRRSAPEPNVGMGAGLVPES